MRRCGGNLRRNATLNPNPSRAPPSRGFCKSLMKPFPAIRSTVALAALLLAAAPAAAVDFPPVPTIHPFLFARKVELVANAPAGEKLRGFPLLVRLSEAAIAGFRYADCPPASLRFATPDGTIVPHEIDAWNETGESTVWVSVPELSGPTRLAMFYGGRGDRSAVADGTVWTAAGYLSVWHLDIDPATGVTADAASAASGAVQNLANADKTAAGVAGGAYRNPASVDSNFPYVEIPRDGVAAIDAAIDDAACTYSAWVRAEAANYGVILNTQPTSPWNSDINGLECGLENGYDLFTIADYGTRRTAQACTPLDGTWHLVTISYDGTDRTVYFDGVRNTTALSQASQHRDAGERWTIGTRPGNRNCQWVGAIDELRVRGAATSAAWVRAEYEAVARTNFVSYGPSRPAMSRGTVITVRGPLPEPPPQEFFEARFVDADGALLRTQARIPRGGFAVPPLAESDERVLAGWTVGGHELTSAELAAEPVEADFVATARFEPRTFSVAFTDADGATPVAPTQTVAWGEAAVAPAAPQKEGFSFLRWDRDFSRVTSDLRVRALWRDASPVPSGAKDVTEYSGSSLFSSFSPLERNDPLKASANSDNLSRMISKVGSGGVLYFPAGTYYFGKRLDISTAGVTLWGAPGAEFVRTGVPNTNSTAWPDNAESGSDYNWATLVFVKASNVRIHGLTFRYDVPTSFSGVVTAVSGNWVTVRLADGRSDLLTGSERFMRINDFDETGRPGDYDLVCSAGTAAGTNYRQPSSIVADADGVKSFRLQLSSSIRVGSRLGMCCSTAYSQAFIVYPTLSAIENTVFEDVEIQNAFGMVMKVAGAKNLTLTRFRVASPDAGAIYATGMDGIHVAALGGTLRMRECEFRGLADDPLNVHCTAGVVGSVSGTTISLSSAVEAPTFTKGDTVKFYSARLGELGTATISSVTTGSSGVTGFKVDAVPDGTAAGSLIGNESRMPAVDIADSRFGVTRARGLLLQTDSRIDVRDCEIHDTRLAGVLLSPSATGTWCEMGPIRDAAITNCAFVACGTGQASADGKNNGAIVVRCNHDGDNGWAFEYGANRNVLVRGCVFRDCPSAGVFAANTTDLSVLDNRFEGCGGRVPAYDGAIVRTEFCNRATVSGNVSRGPGFTEALGGSNSLNGTASGNELLFEVVFSDADGCVLARELVRKGDLAQPPAWSASLTSASGAFAGWAAAGAAAPYDFSVPIAGPLSLTAVYGP